MNLNILWDVVSPTIALILGMGIKSWFDSRPRIIAHYGHISGFHSHDFNKEEALNVNTHSVIVKNNSCKKISNLSISHNFLPHFCINPDIHYSVETLPGGGKKINIPAFHAKEEVTITYLYFPPVTYNQITSAIRADDTTVKIIDVWQVPVLSKKSVFFIWFLIVSGAIAWIYLISNLVVHLKALQ